MYSTPLPTTGALLCLNESNENVSRLVQMSKCGSGSGSTRTGLREWEYKKSPLLQLLGFQRVQDLGRKARRLFEEGRMRYLRERGFEAQLVKYCETDVTSDNLAIIAQRKGNKLNDDKGEGDLAHLRAQAAAADGATADQCWPCGGGSGQGDVAPGKPQAKLS